LLTPPSRSICLQGVLSGHLHTDFGTAATLCGALLAVIVLVLRALFGTGAAGIRTNAAHLLRLLALKAQQLRSNAAERRTLHIRFNARSHHLKMRLL